MIRALVLLAVAAIGCGDTVVVVEVDVRRDLGPLAELEVTARNDGDAITERFDLTGVEFPLTFTVTAGGREGDIELELLARDPAGIARGAAIARGSIAGGNSRRINARLDPADFVVNTLTEGAQRPVFRPGRNGEQITSTSDGGFAVAFVNDCQNPALCDVFVRRFDSDGRPLPLGGSAEERAINSGNYPEVSVPAIAGGASGELAVIWEISTAVLHAAIDDNGDVLTADTAASDPAALDPVDPALALLPGGDPVMTWTQERIDADNPAGVWQRVGADPPVLIRDEASAATPALALSGSSVATCWGEGAALMLGVAAPGQAGTPAVARTFDDGATVLAPNIAAGAELVVGYGVVADGASELLLTRLDPSGDMTGEVVIGPGGPTDTVSVAIDGDGRIAAVWQGCDERGDGDGCGIFLTLLAADLSPLLEAVRINTTTAGDQLAPSVTAIDGGFAAVWTDLSGAPPDDSSAVRARPIYLDAFNL